jgi:hypothetical protein
MHRGRAPTMVKRGFGSGNDPRDVEQGRGRDCEVAFQICRAWALQLFARWGCVRMIASTACPPAGGNQAGSAQACCHRGRPG